MQQIDEYLRMGFSRQQIQKAQDLQRHNQHVDLIDILLKMQPQQKTDSQIIRDYSFDILSPDQRQRIENMPSGLKNMANVCYLNSLIQTYFHNPPFVKEILNFKYPINLSLEGMIMKNEAKAKRIQSSMKLVVQLQRLFAYLTYTNRRYVDPFAVFLNVVDEFGNRFQLGDQKDLAEFNSQFIACVDEGLKYDETKVTQAEFTVLEQPQDLTQSQIISKTPSIVLFYSINQVSNLFFGKTKEFIKFNINQQEKELEDSEQVFLQIILNVIHKNLYSAWEAHNSFLIENLNINTDIIPVAEKTIWITQPPDSLLFQIQRVGYDPIKGLIKLNEEFKFEKEIYADRFLLENKKLVLETSNQLSQLKQNKDKLNSQLNDFLNYQGTKLSMITCLENSLKYATISEQYEKISQVIESTKLSIQLQLSKRQMELDELSKQIERLYAIMKKHKYYLQSILIHEGAAESGHYYTYIYNPLLKKWFKFNDIHVTEVQEDKVLKDAYGDGKQKMNAYCLIYQKANLFENTQNYPNYSKNSSYSQFISQNLKQEVEVDNIKFSNEITEHNLIELADCVVDLYNTIFQQVNEQVRRARQMKRNSFQILTSFPVYLRNEFDMVDIVKWAILDNAIREASQGQKDLRDLLQSQIFLQRIKYNFEQNSIAQKIPQKFIVDKQLLKTLRYRYEEYMLKLNVTNVKQYLEKLQDI
ncbi:hypothetical protein pb186bvf_020157 [Paramecium bursaria]